MSNYAPNVPRDKGGVPKDGYPPAQKALVRTTKENAAASSILLLGHNTTEIEVAAVGQHIGLMWLSQAVVDAKTTTSSVITAAGTGNWDNIVQTNTVRRFVVPISTNPDLASVQGVNRAEGLYPAVAYKTLAGNGSVLTAEL